MSQKSLIIFALVLMGAVSPLLAQEKKVEITPFIGYTFSDGVTVDPLEVNGKFVNEVNPTSGFAYGFIMDYLATENVGIGFLFSEQRSDLEGRYQGGGKDNFTDMKVRNYHGIFTYTWGEEDTTVRPFIFGGLGATQFAFDDVAGYDIEGETRFSSTWGGGVKVFASENIGLRLSGRWTPTYIKTDPGGIWCSPWWPGGCWVVGDPQYANQFEMSAGVIFGF